MYAREQFGKELKEQLAKEQDATEIGQWVHSMYVKHMMDLDDNMLENVLLTLGTMELGAQFAYSHEQLNQFADDLIVGKDVEL